MSRESLRGQLLVSGGGLFDPNFRHTVVLVGEHNAEGALGVVLNRPLGLRVEEAFPVLAAQMGGDAPVFSGGPVQRDGAVLVAELTDPDLLDLRVFGTIGFLAGDVSDAALAAALRTRVFAGYSGWGPGQLEAEIEEGSWILDPARPEDVFCEDPESLWSRILLRKGGPYRRLARVPADPSMN